MKICVTGGAGYVGSRLVPALLKQEHQVTVLDTFWFSDYLENHFHLTKIKGDIRSRDNLKKAFKGQDAVIHLACVSNDPSFDMNPRLGRSINYSCFTDILFTLREQRIQRFIYASSSSVYGVSDEPEVHEDTKKVPLTDYSKFKLACEDQLQRYGTGATWTIVRPATVCGLSPRMRLDLVVNIFTIQALLNKRMTLFGTDQKRPNINVGAMVDAYLFLLKEDEKKIHHQIFNVGFENLTLLEIAELVRSTIEDKDVGIDIKPVVDPRSYHINSDKIKALGFSSQHTIKDAITDIELALKLRVLTDPMNNTNYHNIKKMKELGL